MTGPASSVHPAAGLPDRMALAEFDAGLPDEPQAALIEAHVDGCADCQQILSGLRAARVDLASLAGTPMPAAVAARIATALAAEQDGGRHRAAQVIELRSERRMRRMRVASGLAAGIVLLGGGGYLLADGTGGRDAATSADEDAGGAALPEAAGSDEGAELPTYNRQSLEAGIDDLLTRDSVVTAVPGVTTDGGAAASRTVDPVCLARIPLVTAEALSITRVRYEGRSAIVVIFPGEPGQVQVTVVSDCAEPAVPAVIDEFTAED